jgi:hypothetical protein
MEWIRMKGKEKEKGNQKKNETVVLYLWEGVMGGEG